MRRQLSTALAGRVADPRRVEEVMLDGIEQDPSRRPSEPLDWARSLAAAVEGDASWRRRHRRQVVALGTVGVLLGGAALGGWVAGWPATLFGPLAHGRAALGAGRRGRTDHRGHTTSLVARQPAGAPALWSGIVAGTTVTLPAGANEYVYVGSNAGGNPLANISWTPELSVDASWSGERCISIGVSRRSTGSFESLTGNVAVTGVGLRGYSIIRVFTAETSSNGPGYSGGPERQAPGSSLSLRFSVPARDLVLLAIGGQGTGDLVLTGIDATPIQEGTYSEAGSDVLASAALYKARLDPGTYSAHWSSTSFLTNSGTSLGAAAFILRPK